MATKVKPIRPGETVLCNDDEIVSVTTTSNVALANYCPDEARKAIALWRTMINEIVIDGKEPPAREIVSRLFSQAGGRGSAEQALRDDIRDLRMVRSGDKTKEIAALQKFIDEHGERRDLVSQLKQLEESKRQVKKVIRKLDSLIRSRDLNVLQSQHIRKTNRRLFD